MGLVDRSASDLARMLAARQVSAVEVMQEHLARIVAVNPAVNAVVSLRDSAVLLEEARAADAGPVRGWLHGLPIAVKDLLAVKGLRTTYGSPLFTDHVPISDDLLPARMRRPARFLLARPIHRNGGTARIPSIRCMG